MSEFYWGRWAIAAGFLALAASAQAQDLPANPSDRQCESYLNSLFNGPSPPGTRFVEAVDGGPCADFWQRARDKALREDERRRNSL